jgi:hypothetical protein
VQRRKKKPELNVPLHRRLLPQRSLYPKQASGHLNAVTNFSTASLPAQKRCCCCGGGGGGGGGGSYDATWPTTRHDTRHDMRYTSGRGGYEIINKQTKTNTLGREGDVQIQPWTRRVAAAVQVGWVMLLLLLLLLVGCAARRSCSWPRHAVPRRASWAV